MTPTAQPVLPADATAPVAIEDTHALTEAAGGGHESGGLPQFEFQHWLGQIVYLIFLFAILYFLIAKVFAPRMRRVFDEREQTINTAIATARQVQAEAGDQADAAKAEVEAARASSRATAAAAKARVTEAANARAAEEEAVVNARIAEAETAIGKTRDAAMTNVGTIATETASAIVDRLTGKAPTAAEASAAVKGAA
jgi:F-type H+-transporting ATPase subunit b